MLKKADKNQVRQKRHVRVRNAVKGTAERPRLNVYRSLNHIYAQVIDDVQGHTVACASSAEKAAREAVAEMNKKDAAKYIGKLVGERAKAKGVGVVVFDRGGYLYTGRVAALADGAREAGLEF
ncbi:MAG: 50S ribosomal protein L18 [Eubacteriales bacterium]|nr:50S ribosomal protein L18 [Eubacteriales bacterium]